MAFWVPRPLLARSQSVISKSSQVTDTEKSGMGCSALSAKTKTTGHGEGSR